MNSHHITFSTAHNDSRNNSTGHGLASSNSKMSSANYSNQAEVPVLNFKEGEDL